MGKLYNLARVTTTTVGTGTVTLGPAVASFLTFALAGVLDGDIVSYSIREGSNAEIGLGLYTASGPTLTRTVTKSTNANAPINLSGAAQVAITPRAEDLVPLAVPQARVTLTTGVAVTVADVAGVTNIFLTVANGYLIPIYDTVSYSMYPLTADLTLALDNNAAHTNYHQSGKNFDLFCINDSNTLRLGTGPSWDAGAVAGSAILRGTGAGSTDIQLKNGIWTNTNSILIRFGSASGNTVTIPANCATYIGSFRATADGQASDTVLKRLLFNAWQIAPRAGKLEETSVNWPYSAAAFQQVNASAGNQIEVLFGLPGVLLDVDAFNVVQNSTATARTVVSGIGIDSSTINSGRSQLVQCVNTPITTSESTYRGYPGLGWHEIRWLERGNGTDTQTWYGNNAGAAVHRSGMQLEFWG